MKNILFIGIAAALLSSCQKEKTIAPVTPPPQVQSTQDANLFGTWIMDSSKIDGQPTTATVQDTLYISASKYSDNLWTGTYVIGLSVNTWNTSGDSLIAVYRAKYAVSGPKLWQYVNNKPNANDQRWYHKK